MLLARALARLERPIHSEVHAARAAWPALWHGLPPDGAAVRGAAATGGSTARGAAATRSSTLAGLGAASATAAARAGAIELPSLVTVEGALTGPAAGIGGLLKNYTLLAQRGWRFLAAASGAGGASFLRANSGLYVYSVYDGHFELSVLGKKLESAYAKLGGGSAFGGTLAPAEVRALALAYSAPGVGLEPHPASAVVV